MWAWHLPSLYDLTLRDETVHIFEHLSFMVTSCMFWWPVMCPTARGRLPVGPGLVYLLLGAVSNSALGIALTFWPVLLYPAYLKPRDEYGILADSGRLGAHAPPRPAGGRALDVGGRRHRVPGRRAEYPQALVPCPVRNRKHPV